jgi:hypothetical protein
MKACSCGALIHSIHLELGFRDIILSNAKGAWDMVSERPKVGVATSILASRNLLTIIVGRKICFISDNLSQIDVKRPKFLRF